MADADSPHMLVEVRYKRNKRTKKLHRIVWMPDNGQVLSGEKCNLDDALNVESIDIREAGADDRCRYCFG